MEAADWDDFVGFIGIRKSFEVEIFPLTFFDFDAAAAAVDEDDLVGDFLALPPVPLPLRWLGGDILNVLFQFILTSGK